MAKPVVKKKVVAKKIVGKKPVVKAAVKPKPKVVQLEPPTEGHNSGVNKAQLKSVVERIERLEEEKRDIAEDIKEIYGEAKATGFDIGVIRFLVVQRRKDKEKLRLFKDMAEQYAFLLDPELADVLS